MIPKYIIVQAGGKGTRLGHLTRNKPKALVPVDNLPMLFHLFRKYPDSRYIVIGDYKFDVLERYLAEFAPVEYQLVCASGSTGTCAGLRQALDRVPAAEPFLLIWSDLILPAEFSLPDEPGNYIGIHGKPVYEYKGLSKAERLDILRRIIECLKSVQGLEQAPADRSSCWDAYVGKTFQRLEKVEKLAPFAADEIITINGRRCRNIFGRKQELESALEEYTPAVFKLIHGDCTFSNTMLREDGSPVLIDPRGYFGKTELYGDPAYDWAKLYYSIVGNYDQFNRKRFELEIKEDGVKLQIESNGWEDLEEEFFGLLQGEVTRRQIKLLHAIIWLSLTTYAWENYDSICGAFYNGLYYLEEAL